MENAPQSCKGFVRNLRRVSSSRAMRESKSEFLYFNTHRYLELGFVIDGSIMFAEDLNMCLNAGESVSTFQSFSCLKSRHAGRSECWQRQSRNPQLSAKNIKYRLLPFRFSILYNLLFFNLLLMYRPVNCVRRVVLLCLSVYLHLSVLDS